MKRLFAVAGILFLFFSCSNFIQDNKNSGKTISVTIGLDSSRTISPLSNNLFRKVTKWKLTLTSAANTGLPPSPIVREINVSPDSDIPVTTKIDVPNGFYNLKVEGSCEENSTTFNFEGEKSLGVGLSGDEKDEKIVISVGLKKSSGGRGDLKYELDFSGVEGKDLISKRITYYYKTGSSPVQDEKSPEISMTLTPLSGGTPIAVPAIIDYDSEVPGNLEVGSVQYNGDTYDSCKKVLFP